jgi:hypothetical protein
MKPRNYLVPLALKRKAGLHCKTNKATRRKENAEMVKIMES